VPCLISAAARSVRTRPYVCMHVRVCMDVYAHARPPLIVVDLLRRGSVIVFGAFSIVWISNDSEPARRTSPVFVRTCMRVRGCRSAWHVDGSRGIRIPSLLFPDR